MSKYKLPKIEELLDAGVHFGHQTRRWHPDMEPYIFSVKKNIHIIDLERTEELLGKACEFLFECGKEGKNIVFVGTKRQARDIVEIEAKRSGAHFVTERWLGGTITNFEIIKRNNIDKLLDLKKKKEHGDLEKYTKKERLLIDREIENLERFVGGISALRRVPEILFVIDVKREKTAVREAKKARIPVVALIDTNSDPKGLDYIIPGNDDAIKSVAIVVKALADAVEAGFKEFEKKQLVAKEVKPAEIASQPVVAAASSIEVTSSEAPHVVENIEAPVEGQ